MDRAIGENLEELYVEPITSCNLRCRMCYTHHASRKDGEVLPKGDILAFVGKFAEYRKGPFSIYWCGTGEIFLHPDFPAVVNALSSMYPVQHTVMTNGTIDRLDEFTRLDNVSFRISIDGPKAHHEWNRGKGTYAKSVSFCGKAYRAGCEVQVRCLVTSKNLDHLADFRRELQQTVGSNVSLSLEIAFPKPYLGGMSGSAFISMEFDDSTFLPPEQLRNRVLEKYGEEFAASCGLDPSWETAAKHVQVSLMLNKVYSCCNGVVKIGEIGDSIERIVENLDASKKKCGSCSLLPIC